MAKNELTCMCMIYDKDRNKVVVQERTKSLKGISFPGGHIEDGEGLVEATIREVKEETGLTVRNLKACGVMHWYNDKTGDRYFVFHFKTEDYGGELINETEEGRVFWVDVDGLPNLPLSGGFRERLPMFFTGEYIEGFGIWNDEGRESIKWF